jgi:hypothetical protein
VREVVEPAAFLLIAVDVDKFRVYVFQWTYHIFIPPLLYRGSQGWEEETGCLPLFLDQPWHAEVN